MVGNKYDLIHQSQVPRKCMISNLISEEAEELALELGAKHFYTSAKSS
jgi:hypothetical protein